MTRTKLLVAANLFFSLVVSAALAAQEPFRVRSVFTAQPGDVSVVVELPPGLTPQAADFALVIDNDTVTAREVRGQDIAVMLLVDISGSIKRGPLNDIKKALLSFSDKISSLMMIRLYRRSKRRGTIFVGLSRNWILQGRTQSFTELSTMP
jgi:hypothetical protein